MSNALGDGGTTTGSRLDQINRQARKPLSQRHSTGSKGSSRTRSNLGHCVVRA